MTDSDDPQPSALVGTDLGTEERWMRRSAMHYLGRQATSVVNLRRVLARRAQRRLGADFPAEAMIERTVAFCRRSGFVDDAAFAEQRLHSGVARGHSLRRIGAALAAKGVERAVVAEAIAPENRAAHDEAAALRFARRKRLGPWRRPQAERDERKEMAAMARAGFAPGLARRILGLDAEEAEELLAGTGPG